MGVGRIKERIAMHILNYNLYEIISEPGRLSHFERTIRETFGPAYVRPYICHMQSPDDYDVDIIDDELQAIQIYNSDKMEG